MMTQSFRPVFVVNRSQHLRKLREIAPEDFGILATFLESNNFLTGLRQLDKPYYIDSGVFKSVKNYCAYTDPQKIPWHLEIECFLEGNFWKRRLRLGSEKKLRQFIQHFLDRCGQFSPHYVFAPDVFGEPLLSLHLARLTLEEYERRQRCYQLIGVAQVGHTLYYSQMLGQEKAESLSSFAKYFLSSLLSEYRRLGFEILALGGLLKDDPRTSTGLKFGLNNNELDQFLSWSRPNFILGGLALSRLAILKKHQVWADSSGWIWWNSRYDVARFGERDVMAEVFAKAQDCYGPVIEEREQDQGSLLGLDSRV